MAIPIDFLRLYEELELPSDASLDALRLAYRRRVSELHPDRLHEKDPVSAHRSAESLQRLTVMYAAATTFHRRHGRLPGSSLPRRAGPRTLTPPHAPSPPARRRSRKIAWVGLIAATVAWLLFRPPAEDMPHETAVGAGDEAIAPHRPRMPPPLGALAPGMTAKDVLALEGEPVVRGGDRWSYGPSWIAFDDGRVTDWYSSPLRPLKGARTRPTQR